jgi:hypothetical protein
VEELCTFKAGLVVFTSIPQLLQSLEHGLARLPVVGKIEDGPLGELLGDSIETVSTEQTQNFLGGDKTVTSVSSKVLAPI